jgi:predicted secreted acid phosphatase
MNTAVSAATRTLVGAALAVLLHSGLALGEPPENLADVKAKLYAYKSSGRYEADLAAVISEANSYLEERLSAGGKLAIVLDIDETALSNWPSLKANDLGFVLYGECDLEKGPCGLLSFIKLAQSEPIKPTLELYKRAREKGAAVFFITGRPEPLREATEKNLRAAGYTEWERLFLKPVDLKVATAADFKGPIRCKLVADGYTIVATIGDQPSDLAGGCTEQTFLLPNPFYRVP